jgi:pimeloyl-ACP methyl ester carboxylesterase
MGGTAVDGVNPVAEGGNNMHRSVEVEVDVAAATGLESATLRATAWLPEPVGPDPVVCFAFPGGGYGRHYWSFDLPGESGDGEAGYHLDRGWVFVEVDHLGIGDSTIPEGPVSLELVAAASQALVRDLSARLAEGRIADGFDRLPAFTTLGVGQSLGGLFLLILQAHHGPFDGIGMLGSSAIQNFVPTRPGTPPIPFPWIARSTAGATPVVLNADRLSGELDLSGDAARENPLQWAFHFDDESPEIVAIDMATEPLARWRSATVPDCGLLGVTPFVATTEAAGISVPVFVGLGERDVIPNPWLEPLAYRSSRDITLFVCEAMAHMHNFASTRTRFWQRLHHWGQGVALQRIS